MLVPESGGKLDIVGAQEVKNKMGVFPEQIRDLLALMGDSSDNIPGVPGVGPKTAQKILEKAGSVDRLIDDPSLAGNPKLETKIVDNKQSLILSKELATLKIDVGMNIDLESLKARQVHTQECIEFFKELDFHSLLKHPMFANKKRLDYSVHIPATLEEVREIAAKISAAGFVSIDAETTGLVPRQAKLVGISLAIDKKEAFYIPVGHDGEAEGKGAGNLPLGETVSILKGIVESSAVAKIGQNLKYDYQIFKNYGLTLANISFDTMVAAYLIDPGTGRITLMRSRSNGLGSP